MCNIIKALVVCVFLGGLFGIVFGYPLMAFLGSPHGPHFNPFHWMLEVRSTFVVLVIGCATVWTWLLFKVQLEKYITEDQQIDAAKADALTGPLQRQKTGRPDTHEPYQEDEWGHDLDNEL